jgi:hypothetical protein
MANLIKNLKDFRCNNCGIEYQSLHAYQHVVLGVVCNDCMDVDVTDSKWA